MTGEIRLRCSLAQFGELDLAEETDLAEGVSYGGGYGDAESVSGYGDAGGMGVGGSVSGMGIGMGLGHRTRTVVHDVVPLGETEIRRGEPVHALDGEIGQVQGFLVDPADHHVTHVLLQEGHLWGRKEVTIPISAVTGATTESGSTSRRSRSRTSRQQSKQRLRHRGIAGRGLDGSIRSACRALRRRDRGLQHRVGVHR